MIKSHDRSGKTWQKYIPGYNWPNILKKENKPADRWGIGTEHEKFLYRASDLKRLDYFSVPASALSLFICRKKDGSL